MSDHILIIQTAFTGDVILALPLAQRLRAEFPQAVIHFLVRKGNENLLQFRPDVDVIHVWDKKNQKKSGLIRLIQELRKYQFRLAVNCQRFLSTGLIMAALHAEFKTGFAENPLSFLYTRRYPHTRSEKGSPDPLHEVDRNIRLLSGISDISREVPSIRPEVRELEKVKNIIGDKQIIVLAPASVWQTKQWPPEYWQQLVKSLPDIYTPVIIGGPGDYQTGQFVLEGQESGMNLCGKLSFRESAALMSLAVRVICNDSAPLHLASSVNAPVTAIYCSTIPEFGFYPLSQDAIVLEEQNKLNCRPCGLHGHKVCPEGHFSCGRTILPERVLKTIKNPV